MDAPYYSASDTRDELTQPEPVMCCPCDDEGEQVPATDSIDRGEYKVSLPVCKAHKRAYEAEAERRYYGRGDAA